MALVDGRVGMFGLSGLLGSLRRLRRSTAVVATAAVLFLSGLTVFAPPALATPARTAPPATQQDKSVPVHPAATHYQKPKAMPQWKPAKTSWPTGTATVTVPTAPAQAAAGANANAAPAPAKPVQAGSLPVWVGPATSAPQQGKTAAVAQPATPSSVDVTLAPRSTASALGVNGVVLSAARADQASTTGSVALTLGYGQFEDAYGADWASRLRLVELPGCALSTPKNPSCRTATPLTYTRDATANSLTANVTLPGATGRTAAPMVLAATSSSGAGSGGGSFSATQLKASGSWGAGGSADSFSYSYPISMPQVPGALAPPVALSYDSQALDGLTSSTNNQASWVGDGWEYTPGYIQRAFDSCENNPAGPTKTPDSCWSPNNTLTLYLDGQSTQLIYNSATGTYRAAQDQNDRVQYETGASNGANNGEYFIVTTTDGTKYYFGLNHLPGYDTGGRSTDPATNSVDTEPVYATASGQPCYNATWANSWCQQAYQWNLDYVVDTHSDVASYFYNTETNYYARDLGTTANTSYIRGSYLAKIQYGQRDGAVYSSQPAAQVVFTSTGRCNQSSCAPATLSTSTASNWPDVPYDLNCANNASCQAQSPSFWSEYTLQSIETYALDGTTESPVDSWALTHSFPDPGDTTPTGASTTPALWLASITHTGLDTNGGGSTASITLPTVTFTGQALANRVDLTDGYPPITRFRLTQITTETGEQITANYSSASCPSPAPDPSTNTGLCYPDYWTPDGAVNPMLDWFNKYIVKSVTEVDPTGGSANDTIQTTYQPVGNPAWHYNDNPLTLAAQRTWDQWRGYSGMIVTIGTAPDPVQKTQYVYFRGMDGDTLPNNGTRPATVSDLRGDPPVTDSNQFDGLTYETVVYNGTAVVTDTVDTPWTSAATASQSYTGLPAAQAFMTGTAETKVYTPLANGTTRESDTLDTYDSLGRITKSSDRADVLNAAEDTCTTTTYADNPNLWIYDRVDEITDVSVNCSTTPALPADAISDKRTFYDGSTTLGAAPTIGNPTMTQEATSYTGSTPNLATMTTLTPDEYGRPTATTDADNNKTTYQYSPATGAQPTLETQTDPMGHVETTTEDPGRSLPEVDTDAAGFVTTQQYDSMGRLTAVYKPGEPVGQPPNIKYTYDISDSGPSVVDTYALDDDGTYRLTEELYDSMLRERETQTETPVDPNTGTNGRDITDIVYNTDGLESVSTDPYYNSSPPSSAYVQAQSGDVPSEVGTAYDSDGRKTSETAYELGLQTWQSTYTYGGDFVTTQPPNGATPTTTITDARGRQTDLLQYHTGVPVDPINDPPSDYADTHYTYFPDDKQATVADAAGNTWSYQYNLLGDQTSATDPDSGTTTNIYDDNNLLQSTTDARGKQISTSYDADGRKIATYDTTGGAQETAADEIASWGYDSATGPNGPAVGYASSTTSYSNGDAFTDTINSYNLQAQVAQTTDTLTGTDSALVPSSGYVTSYVYSPTGNLKTQKDPAAGGLKAESLNYTYDQFGEATALNSTSIGSQQIYVSSIGYDHYGKPLLYTFPTTGGDVWLNLNYDQQTGNLVQATTTDSSSAADVDDLTYQYGNSTVSKGADLITSTTDKQNGGAITDTQCFNYDYATRLQAAWTATDNCAATPAPGNSATVGGPDPYWQSWTYNAAGDRTSQVDHDTTGNTNNDSTTTYNYPSQGSATDQPNTLSNTTATGPNAAADTTSYHYDADGNTTSMTGGSLGDQTLSYGDDGKLASDTLATGTVGYVYDADGNLLVRRDPGQTTLFLGDMQLQENTSTGAITGTRYYTVDGTTIATRTAGVNSGNTQYLIPDRQGTDELLIDSSTQQVSRRQYLPFGGVRGTAPSSWDGGDKGYIGGLPDSTTGLEDLGAREYDANDGRFLSVDPVFEDNDPIEMGGYDYSGNDPATGSDPTGECFLGCFFQAAVHFVANVQKTAVHLATAAVHVATHVVASAVAVGVKTAVAVQNQVSSAVNTAKAVVTAAATVGKAAFHKAWNSPVMTFIRANRTTILGGLSIATFWCPPLSIGLGVASAASSAWDVRNDIVVKHDAAGAVLDGLGGILSVVGVGVAFRGLEAARELEEAQKAAKAAEDARQAIDPAIRPPLPRTWLRGSTPLARAADLARQKDAYYAALGVRGTWLGIQTTWLNYERGLAPKRGH